MCTQSRCAGGWDVGVLGGWEGYGQGRGDEPLASSMAFLVICKKNGGGS